MSAIVFTGIEGSNPLGFLAALGALRLAAGLWREPGVRLRWRLEGGWRPELSGAPVTGEAEFCRALHEQASWAPLQEFDLLGNNLTVPRSTFAPVVENLARRMTAHDRRAADFAAAFGSDVFEDKEKDRIEHTDLCFITGSGRQDFLGTARKLVAKCQPEHLQEALFGPWRYRDGLSMRWDPGDAREYALRWSNPGPEGASAVWGANRLAFEALPLFPTVPAADGLRTTGFRIGNRAQEFTWPVWSGPAGVDTVRSLLSLSELENAEPDHARLRAMGVAEVFRSRRVRIGQGANFKVSFRPARAV
jgi:hypothetical protein